MSDLFGMKGREPGRLLAVSEDGGWLYYGDAQDAGRMLGGVMGGRSLVFLLCDNSPGALLGYLGCLQCGAVPLLLDANIAPELLAALADTYRPAFFLVPQALPAAARAVLPRTRPLLRLRGSILLAGGEKGPALHPELRLLLTTSGSTGSPKLVRLSAQNLEANAASPGASTALPAPSSSQNRPPGTARPMLPHLSSARSAGSQPIRGDASV